MFVHSVSTNIINASTTIIILKLKTFKINIISDTAKWVIKLERGFRVSRHMSILFSLH